MLLNKDIQNESRGNEAGKGEQAQRFIGQMKWHPLRNASSAALALSNVR